jgi:group I intron endonuclease
MKFNYDGNSWNSGIYVLKNTVTGKCYIGSAREFKERWRSHSSSLRRNKHRNKYLQSSFSLHVQEQPSDDFMEFSILEILNNSTKQERLTREEYWIDKYKADNIGLYNNNHKPSKEAILWSKTPKKTKLKHRKKRKNKSYDKFYGVELAQEIRNKQKESHRQRFENMTPEQRQAINDSLKGAGNPFYGRTHNEETKKLIGSYRKGKTLKEVLGEEKATEISIKMSKITRERIRNNPEHADILASRIRGKTLEKIYGKERAKEIKRKRSRSRSRAYSGFQLLSPDGTLYTEIEYLAEFCKSHNLLIRHMYRLLGGKAKTHRGWKILPEFNNLNEDSEE